MNTLDILYCLKYDGSNVDTGLWVNPDISMIKERNLVN